MCLYVKDKIKISKFPILTWKYVYMGKNNVDNTKHYWMGPYYANNWFDRQKYNEVLKAKDMDIHSGVDFVINHLKYSGCSCNNIINAGFHSFLKHGDAQFDRRRVGITRYTVVPCIIPRGTEYCKGMHGDVVSLHLIVFENVWQMMWNFYKAFKKVR